MQNDVFNSYHSETEMMRYIKRLENKDLSLTKSINFVLELYQQSLEGIFNKSKKPFVYNDSIDLLNKVKSNKHYFGLLSGNLAKAAKIKLNKFDLWDKFQFGVFGEDAASRDDLVWVAREKAWDVFAESFRFEDIILVGDTDADAQAAYINGAKSIIVCRLPEKINILKKSNATLVVKDLSRVNINHVFKND